MPEALRSSAYAVLPTLAADAVVSGLLEDGGRRVLIEARRKSVVASNGCRTGERQCKSVQAQGRSSASFPFEILFCSIAFLRFSFNELIVP